ncbi:MAG: 3-mercaptopyruvate sulfurtransferase [Alphaproteobacteria bacterium]
MGLFGFSPPTLPSPLVEPEWLKANLGRVNLLDATFAMPGSGRNPAAEFHARHIPTAQFFDLEIASDPETTLPHMLPAPEAFADYMRQLGVDERKPTIIYDDGAYLGATRLWWMLRVFGHDNIALLHGGLPAWQAAGHPLTDKIDPPGKGRFTATFRPELVWSLAQVTDNLEHGDTVMLDARASGRFRGEQPEPRPGLARGHIPGSLNLPFSELIDPATKQLWPAARLKEIFTGAGINSGESITATCGSGVSACVLAFGLFLLGRGDVPVYDGSWAEWGADKVNPVMLGPPQRLKTPILDD